MCIYWKIWYFVCITNQLLHCLKMCSTDISYILIIFDINFNFQLIFIWIWTKRTTTISTPTSPKLASLQHPLGSSGYHGNFIQQSKRKGENGTGRYVTGNQTQKVFNHSHWWQLKQAEDFAGIRQHYIKFDHVTTAVKTVLQLDLNRPWRIPPQTIHLYLLGQGTDDLETHPGV